MMLFIIIGNLVEILKGYVLFDVDLNKFGPMKLFSQLQLIIFTILI